MQFTQKYQEETIRTLLGGDEQQINEGLTLLEQQLHQPLTRSLGRQFPGLSEEDLADVWGETLLGVLKAVRKSRFNSARPLLPWLCVIGKARATDQVRRQSVREKIVQGQCAPTSGRQSHRSAGADRLALAEMLELIDAALATMPPRQRPVLRTYVDCLPESRDMTVLRLRVSERTGMAESLPAIKRALQEARLKLRTFLRHSGFVLAR